MTTIDIERLRRAVNAVCSCGGSGPHDPGCCPACHIWHLSGAGEADAAATPATPAAPPACASCRWWFEVSRDAYRAGECRRYAPRDGEPPVTAKDYGCGDWAPRPLSGADTADAAVRLVKSEEELECWRATARGWLSQLGARRPVGDAPDSALRSAVCDALEILLTCTGNRNNQRQP